MIPLMQIVGLALIGACFSVLLRSQNGTAAALLSLSCCICIYVIGFRLFSPILSLVKELQVLSGMQDSITAPMIKATGIGIISQTAANVCEDAGEKALAKVVLICSSVLTLYVTVPLLHAVIDLLKQIVGGSG